MNISDNFRQLLVNRKSAKFRVTHTFERPLSSQAAFNSTTLSDSICDLVGTHGNQAGGLLERNLILGALEFHAKPGAGKMLSSSFASAPLQVSRSTLERRDDSNEKTSKPRTRRSSVLCEDEDVGGLCNRSPGFATSEPLFRFTKGGDAYKVAAGKNR